MKVFKQKIKHLLFEHKAAIDHLRSENTVALKLAAEEHRIAESHLRRDKASLKEQVHHEQLKHEELVNTLKKVCKTLLLCVLFYQMSDNFIERIAFMNATRDIDSNYVRLSVCPGHSAVQVLYQNG